jgi:hypothetical protein
MRKTGKLQKPVKTGALTKDEKPTNHAAPNGRKPVAIDQPASRKPTSLVAAPPAAVDPSTKAPPTKCESCGATSEAGLAVVYHKPGCKAYSQHNAQPGQSHAHPAHAGVPA